MTLTSVNSWARTVIVGYANGDYTQSIFDIEGCPAIKVAGSQTEYSSQTGKGVHLYSYLGMTEITGYSDSNNAMMCKTQVILECKVIATAGVTEEIAIAVAYDLMRASISADAPSFISITIESVLNPIEIQNAYTVAVFANVEWLSEC